jgi:hypothetical protein
MKNSIFKYSVRNLLRLGGYRIQGLNGMKNFSEMDTELLKNKRLSIYDFDMQEEETIYQETLEHTSTTTAKDSKLKNILKREEALINDNDIYLKLSEFLKSMELSRHTELKSNLYIDARNILTILNNETIKRAYLEIYGNEKVELLSIQELTTRLTEIEEKFRSYETVFDESYYNDIIKLFSQVAKFLLKHEIYHVDHNIDSQMSGKRNILTSFSITKSLIEDLKLSELNDQQLVRLLPIIVMLNNIYNLPGYVMNNVILEITGRIKTGGSADTLKEYLKFILVQNSCRQSYSILNNLVEFKDIILTTDSNANDLLYLLTDNIYKFVVNKDDKTEDYIASFYHFIKSYGSTKLLISRHVDINEDLLENFFSSLYILSKTEFINDSVRLTISGLLKDIFDTRSSEFVNRFYNSSDGISLLTGLEIDTHYLADIDDSSRIFDKVTDLSKNNTLKKEIVTYAGLNENFTAGKERYWL